MQQTYEVLQSRKKPEDAFSPSTPISLANNFIGRYHELKEILNAIKEKGKHILLYGKRGVGKTSLSNIMISKCKEKNKNIAIYKSSAVYAMSFSELWESLLEQIEDSKLHDIVEQKIKKKIDVRTIVTLLIQSEKTMVFIIDEFDLISQEEKNKNAFASLIKSLSDSCPHITLVLIGIGNKIDELIGHHASLERCLVEFHLPQMKEKEIRDLIEGGGRKVGLHFQEEVKKKIIDYSVGYPHFAHLLAKHCCEHALNMHYNCVIMKNFHEGMKNAIESSKTLFKKQIIKATSTKNPNYKEILFLAARQESRAFTAKELREKNPHLKTKFAFYLSQLAQKNRGEVFEKKYDEKNQTTYQFKSPLFLTYLSMEIQQEKISEIKRSPEKAVHHFSLKREPIF